MTGISQEELYILDPELVLKETVGTSPGMPDLVDSEEHQDQQRQFKLELIYNHTTHGHRPLHWRSVNYILPSSNTIQLMELHQQGADLLLQDAAGCTLLHHAVRVESKEIVKYLIDHGKSRPSDVNSSWRGETALHKAATSCQRSICHYLVEGGASLMKTDLQGETPKQHAERARDQDLAEYLENRQHYQMIQREDHETAV
uniref:Uncharacterized protein n=1 Tax=Seriola lalandi dorsalis TaxID=1841481 RepID=A0A3B4Y0I8_SERLL